MKKGMCSWAVCLVGVCARECRPALAPGLWRAACKFLRLNQITFSSGGGVSSHDTPVVVCLMAIPRHKRNNHFYPGFGGSVSLWDSGPLMFFIF